MRLNAVIAGVAMTRFGKHLDKSLKQLGGEPVLEAVKDAGIELRDIEAAYVGNCAAGIVTGQESIRGQVILSSIGLGKIPIINIENACGSSSTALNQACMMVSAGYYDVVLVVGVEKLYHENKAITYSAFSGAVDVEERDKFIAEVTAGQSEGSGETRSVFADFYGVMARDHMRDYGSTPEHFAMARPTDDHTSPHTAHDLPGGGRRCGGGGRERAQGAPTRDREARTARIERRALLFRPPAGCRREREQSLHRRSLLRGGRRARGPRRTRGARLVGSLRDPLLRGPSPLPTGR
jgi:hypothetical protein